MESTGKFADWPGAEGPLLTDEVADALDRIVEQRLQRIAYYMEPTLPISAQELLDACSLLRREARALRTISESHANERSGVPPEADFPQ